IVVDGPICRMTPMAEGALATGNSQRTRAERQVFHFPANPGAPPQFINLHGARCTPTTPHDRWSFDPAILAACIDRPVHWKLRHGFPQEVRGLPGWQSDARQPPANDIELWHTVILDRPERMSAVLVKSGRRLQAIQLSDESRNVVSSEPIFTVID